MPGDQVRGEEESYAMHVQELQSACKAKDTLHVGALLTGSSVKATDASACLPMAWPNVEVMRLLLEHGADPNVCATVWYMKKSIEVVRLLVEFGLDIRATGHLILQDFAHDREALDWLLDQGVDASQTDHKRVDTGRPPGGAQDYSLKVLNNIAARGDIDLFDHIVKHGADPHRSLALHCASKCQDPEKSTAMIDHLLDVHNMDIEADNERLRDFFHAAGDSGTPLRCAVYYQNLPAVRRLLERGANPGKALYTTIDNIISAPWEPALEPLLNACASADEALEHAVDHLNFEAAKICVAKGADAAMVLGKQQSRLAKIEARTFDYTRDEEHGARGFWSEDDEETAGCRRDMRAFLKSASLSQKCKTDEG